MNKQELINHIKDQNEWLGNHRFILIKKEELISMIEDLDEPQKVKVPAFVAEWFETNKYVLDRAILDYMFEDYASDNSEFGKWFDNKNGKPIETLVRMLDGYEVEEEPKWIVCYSTMYLKSPLETGQIETVEITPKKELACHFKSYKEAKQQTSLIGGAVEKV
ncbi:DUF1642 domain-containing protein [Enterococcus viikkiensis]|uniref:DUF1642 domain-containing protein n=1 Tax=Enterococcus viikkiensis TaxID=930854 RepID=UPI0010F8F270|nr:DUF1642 domain-containing protein [Enterococcus viikkiensis]